MHILLSRRTVCLLSTTPLYVSKQIVNYPLFVIAYTITCEYSKFRRLKKQTFYDDFSKNYCSKPHWKFYAILPTEECADSYLNLFIHDPIDPNPWKRTRPMRTASTVRARVKRRRVKGRTGTISWRTRTALHDQPRNQRLAICKKINRRNLTGYRDYRLLIITIMIMTIWL